MQQPNGLPSLDSHQHLAHPYGFSADPYAHLPPPSTQAYRQPDLPVPPRAFTSKSAAPSSLLRVKKKGKSTASAASASSRRTSSAVKSTDTDYKNFMDLKRDEADAADRSYKLIVRQDPEKARLCSFKEENETSDRRPIDPPPIVEIRTSESDSTEFLEATSLFVTVTLVATEPSSSSDEENDEDRPEKPSNPTQLRQQGGKRRRSKQHTPDDFEAVTSPGGGEATTGEVVLTPEKFKDTDGRMSSFCVFSKLSVRLPGKFRLRLTLYEHVGLVIVKMACVLTNEFEVFSPKQFTGMKESTALTRHFAHQGLKIKLRTGGPLAATGKTKQGSPMSAPKTGGMKEKKKGKWMDDGGTDALLGADDGLRYSVSYAAYPASAGPSSSSQQQQQPRMPYPNVGPYSQGGPTSSSLGPNPNQQRSAIDLSSFSLSGPSTFDGPPGSHPWVQLPPPTNPSHPYTDPRYSQQHLLPPLYAHHQQQHQQQSYYNNPLPTFSYQNIDSRLTDSSNIDDGGGGGSDQRVGREGSRVGDGSEGRGVDEDRRGQYREASGNSFYDSSTGQDSSTFYNNMQPQSSSSESPYPSYPHSYNPSRQQQRFYSSSSAATSQQSPAFPSSHHHQQPQDPYAHQLPHMHQQQPPQWQTNYASHHQPQLPDYSTYPSEHHPAYPPPQHQAQEPHRQSYVPPPPPPFSLDPPSSASYSTFSSSHPSSSSHLSRDPDPSNTNQRECQPQNTSYRSFTQQYLHPRPPHPSHPSSQADHQNSAQYPHSHPPDPIHQENHCPNPSQNPSLAPLGDEPNPHATAASLADRPRKSHSALQSEHGRRDTFGFSHRSEVFRDDGLQHGSRQYGEFWDGQRDFRPEQPSQGGSGKGADGVRGEGNDEAGKGGAEEDPDAEGEEEEGLGNDGGRPGDGEGIANGGGRVKDAVEGR